ncbi:hypothetical protein DET47_113115 [Shewanella putrefaciens]|nr:hypothetical protein DET47_113115 [Shewanella putrefaciens]
MPSIDLSVSEGYFYNNTRDSENNLVNSIVELLVTKIDQTQDKQASKSLLLSDRDSLFYVNHMNESNV